MKYIQPQEPLDAYGDWSGYLSKDFTPSPRQQILIDTYLAAEAKGLFYSDEIVVFAIEHLEIPVDVAAIGAKRVEGGEVGMDMYYARNCVRAQRTWKERADALEKLNPVVGMELGSLCVNYKRTNACVVTAVEGDMVSVSCKRGRLSVTFKTPAVNIIGCAQTAFEKKWRKAPLV